MSTKTFCDACGRELIRYTDNITANPIEPSVGGVNVRIETGFNKLGQGDVCARCVVTEVIRLAKARGWMPKEPESSTRQP